MKNTGRALGILIFLIFLVLLTTVFTITQGQHGILLRLGRLVNEGETNKVKVLNPGLHFKVPFIENVRIFDTRIQTKDIKSTRIVTREKKDVMVDYYVKWQIVDLAQYFKSTGGSEFKAETLLEQQLNTLLRAQFGKRTIPEVVSGGRDDVMQLLRKAAQKQAGELGINVVDVRIKGIELPASTSNEIYQRMRADMQEIANRHRADGQAAAEQIQAKADADVMVLLAKTRSAAQKVRAIGQAKAASIYAEAYSKNKEFFALYRSLLAYEASFTSKKDILVLDQSSAFFDYFKQATPKNDGVPVKK
ncbi:protease modulator HflC [Legionella longbeachae]|uniref:Protein HflC n=1 Tax=Legionella longbeachae serogroup 1 (strain NSW150) TaxID=661367 RepID=D3HL12_LEGLN|nr:protease modulator HflC [Legionella longbeachae]VEE03639.1 membrane protease subunit HflC [Legionella oakridgensis]HBD7397555.1 protease modulator HflC [Legionella pneumophila]ARB93477.1 protease modulator HflC [Legionella longbeachae]ARM33418.1 protease modulator HflC [Legionella longbeachae]EEZ93735.1 HflC protein [Legionella longbeachae D-4968]